VLRKREILYKNDIKDSILRQKSGGGPKERKMARSNDGSKNRVTKKDAIGEQGAISGWESYWEKGKNNRYAWRKKKKSTHTI